MTGDILARLLRAALHEDTFERFVSPAIADLQYSPTSGGYLAVWLSFAGALGADFANDLDCVLNDIGLMLALVAMQVCYYGGMFLLLIAHVRADQMVEYLARGGGSQAAAVLMALALAALLPTVLCFWPPRRTLDA